MPVMPPLRVAARALLIALGLLGALPAVAADPAEITVLISVDMEGVAGVVTSDQTGPEGFEYERFRGFMTDAAIADVRGALGNIEAAEVKRALSSRAADSMTPQAATALIRERTQRAIEQRAKYTALRVPGPVEVESSFSKRRHAELLALLPMFERGDARSVRFRARDMLEASRVELPAMHYPGHPLD